MALIKIKVTKYRLNKIENTMQILYSRKGFQNNTIGIFLGQWPILYSKLWNQYLLALATKHVYVTNVDSLISCFFIFFCKTKILNSQII